MIIPYTRGVRPRIRRRKLLVEIVEISVRPVSVIVNVTFEAWNSYLGYRLATWLELELANSMCIDGTGSQKSQVKA